MLCRHETQTAVLAKTATKELRKYRWRTHSGLAKSDCERNAAHRARLMRRSPHIVLVEPMAIEY